MAAVVIYNIIRSFLFCVLSIKTILPGFLSTLPVSVAELEKKNKKIFYHLLEWIAGS